MSRPTVLFRTEDGAVVVVGGGGVHGGALCLCDHGNN